MSVLNTQEIQEILPHRYPMLMLDTVEELVPGEKTVAIKNITINEEVFQGHFPGNPTFFPNTNSIAFDSAASLAPVAVPCALT